MNDYCPKMIKILRVAEVFASTRNRLILMLVKMNKSFSYVNFINHMEELDPRIFMFVDRFLGFMSGGNLEKLSLV